MHDGRRPETAEAGARGATGKGATRSASSLSVKAHRRWLRRWRRVPRLSIAIACTAGLALVCGEAARAVDPTEPATHRSSCPDPTAITTTGITDPIELQLATMRREAAFICDALSDRLINGNEIASNGDSNAATRHNELIDRIDSVRCDLTGVPLDEGITCDGPTKVHVISPLTADGKLDTAGGSGGSGGVVALSAEDRSMFDAIYNGLHSDVWFLIGIAGALLGGYGLIRAAFPR